MSDNKKVATIDVIKTSKKVSKEIEEENLVKTKTSDEK